MSLCQSAPKSQMSLPFAGAIKSRQKILMGGPMMGIALASDQLPVLKQNNGILAFAEEDSRLPEPTACIRCGRCVKGCPMNLEPTLLEKYAELKRPKELTDLGIMCCMGAVHACCLSGASPACTSHPYGQGAR